MSSQENPWEVAEAEAETEQLVGDCLRRTLSCQLELPRELVDGAMSSQEDPCSEVAEDTTDTIHPFSLTSGVAVTGHICRPTDHTRII